MYIYIYTLSSELSSIYPELPVPWDLLKVYNKLLSLKKDRADKSMNRHAQFK